MPEGKFQGNSAYTGDYIGSKAEKNVQFRPNGELKVGEGYFDGVSSYSTDYLNKGKPTKADQIRPLQQLKVGGSFSGSSSYGDAYNGRK